MKVIRLKENDLKKYIAKIIKENTEHGGNYMFFSNLKQMKRQCEMLLQLDENMVNQLLEQGHDWADDHVTVAKENLSQVFDFMLNEFKGSGEEEQDPFYDREEEINYGAEEDEMEPKDNGIMNESVQKIKNQFKRFF